MEKLEILIATGNSDKFRRMAKWLNGLNINLFSFNHFDTQFTEEAKLTDAEEKLIATMNDRAVAKAHRAASALSKTFPLKRYIVLSLDDTGYFPLINKEIVDLRTPPAIYKDSKIISATVTGRLKGVALPNFYSRIVDVFVEETDEMRQLGYKYMPVTWKFALALGNSFDPSSTRVICNWEHTEYMRNIKLKEDIADTGYMLDLITSHTIHGPVNRDNPNIWDEREPQRTLQRYLAQFRNHVN